MISHGYVVSFRYSLKNSVGVLLDTSGREPLSYLHGAHNIVPGLERALDGRRPGDRFSVVVPPSEGYGHVDSEERLSVPRAELPEAIHLGIPLMLEGGDGHPEPAWIVEITDDEVVLDRNHPLAGVALHFDVEVVVVREATNAEKIHGQAHGGVMQ